jgi:hypothetical protein
MTRRILVQTIPVGYGMTTAEVDVTVFEEADPAEVEEEHRQKAAIADLARAQNTRGARAARRFRRALTVATRGSWR